MFETKVNLHNKYAMISREVGFEPSTGELFKMLLSEKEEASSIYASQRDEMVKYIIEDGCYSLLQVNELPLDDVYDICKFIETLSVDFSEGDLSADVYDGLKALQQAEDIVANLRAVKPRVVYDKRKIIF